jgi:hypothetical protein
VAKVFNLAPEAVFTKDNELSNTQKTNQLSESLLHKNSNLDTTNMVHYGGTILAKDILALKRVLFRSTRGRAIITTFDLSVNEEDVIRDDTFHKDKIGYIVLVENSGPMRSIVERACKSYVIDEADKVFECNPREVANML